MEREHYQQRMEELSSQFKNFRRLHCYKCATDRFRKMARLYAEYKSITFAESLEYLQRLHQFQQDNERKRRTT